MNPRTVELMEQATAHAIVAYSIASFDVWKKRYTEKLVELVAVDCILACHKHEDINGTPVDCINEIKQHFNL